MYVEAKPLWSVRTVQFDPPPHAENANAGEAVNCMLAPATGVIPSDCTTRTANGEGACPPTGVAGFEPDITLRISPGPAPTVSTPVTFELPPVLMSLGRKS